MGETFSEKHNRLDHEAHTHFLPIYGEVMLSWATIEDALCDWFEYVSGMKPAQARSVFFSARSFAGRAAILNALLPVPSGKPIVMEFVRAANDKCVAYSSIRNQIAHRIPIMDAPAIPVPVTFRWLSDHGMDVGLHCHPCGRHVVVPVTSLPIALDTLVPAMTGCFKCTRCGSTKTEAQPEWQRRI